jgi:hypothetical protein
MFNSFFHALLPVTIVGWSELGAQLVDAQLFCTSDRSIAQRNPLLWLPATVVLAAFMPIGVSPSSLPRTALRSRATSRYSNSCRRWSLVAWHEEVVVEFMRPAARAASGGLRLSYALDAFALGEDRLGPAEVDISRGVN